ncbi:MAG TPA: MFS transporter, partial [Nakamurella sp.]
MPGYPGDPGYPGQSRGARESDYRSDPGYDPRIDDYDTPRRGSAGGSGDRYGEDRYAPPPPRDDRYRDDRYADDPYADNRHGPDDRGPVGEPQVRRRAPGPPSSLPPYHEPFPPQVGTGSGGPATAAAAVAGAAGGGDAGTAVPPGTGGRAPRKLTVTRVAALRSRELTQRGVTKFHGAVSADGADRSGLTHLTYAVMANYAVDAALAVALANTLFFAAAKADSTAKVLLYLLLTVAPFAVIAPLIGPLLDRIQTGRRVALAVSSFGRALLALTMAIKFDSWVIYPCALGMLVLSKSFGVLKAALTPRVLPEEITLVKTNSRLSVFGMIAGGLSGALAAGLSWAGGSPAALIFTAICAVVCGVLCLRIPSWVESTAGEVPVRKRDRDPQQQVFPPAVSATLWTNATIRIETGFLALFIAFVVKSRFQPRSVVAPSDGTVPPAPHTDFSQLLLLGVVGAAAGVGGFVGNALGARLTLRNPERVAVISLGAIILSVLVAILMPGLVTAGIVAFVGSTGSSLAKVCLDSVIQRDLPEVNRASAFGRSESVLQLSWVFGGVIGLLTGGVWALSQG